MNTGFKVLLFKFNSYRYAAGAALDSGPLPAELMSRGASYVGVLVDDLTRWGGTS
jgi:hypothetical protein